MSARDSRELEAILAAQRDFLQTSCRAFDEGREHEAVRLAVTLRVLVHDTHASHSLLQQMGVKAQWHYLSLCAAPDTERPWSGHLLAEAVARARDTITQPTTDRGQSIWTDFDSWWTSEISHVGAHAFTRKDVVLAQANKEGGAHVDVLTEAQAAVSADVDGWQTSNLDFGTYARMTVRAIAEEMRRTIDAQFAAGDGYTAIAARAASGVEVLGADAAK